MASKNKTDPDEETTLQITLPRRLKAAAKYEAEVRGQKLRVWVAELIAKNVKERAK